MTARNRQVQVRVHQAFGEPVSPGAIGVAELRAVGKADDHRGPGEETGEPSLCGADPGDFEFVFRRYCKPVWAFIHSLIGDRSQAEELTQETFIRAFRNIQTRQESSRLSTWLFGIAHNVAREAIRRKYRKRRMVGLDVPEFRNLQDGRQTPDETVLTREMARKIQNALGCLTEGYRSVFVLKILYRLPYEEISAITGVSIAKLKTDLHRARLEMRRRLRPYVGQKEFQE